MVQLQTVSQPSATSDVILRTSGLTKRFGSFVAVDGLNLEVRRGEVLGFLGPNGAGKSTTVGMILGLIKPSAGHIDYNGLTLRQIGAIIEAPAFYPYLSGRDNLEALALAAGGVARRRIDELLDYVGLADRPRAPYRTYSLGMKQRLGIASTLLLDPAGQREIRALIPQLAREGRSVLLASHLLHEVEQVCDRVAIVRKGRLIQAGSVREIVGQGSFLEVAVSEPDRAAQILTALPFVERVELQSSGSLAVYTSEEHGPDVTRALSAASLYISSMTRRAHSLEEVFLELTDDAAPAGEAS